MRCGEARRGETRRGRPGDLGTPASRYLASLAASLPARGVADPPSTEDSRAFPLPGFEPGTPRSGVRRTPAPPPPHPLCARRSMVAAPGHTYSFEDAHRVYCKGFGNIPAYFVKCTFDPPPSDLLAQLALSPNYGGFYFDGIGNTAAPANGPNEDAASCLSGPMGAQAASRHNSRPQLVDEPELLTSLTPRADVVSIGEK